MLAMVCNSGFVGNMVLVFGFAVTTVVAASRCVRPCGISLQLIGDANDGIADGDGIAVVDGSAVVDGCGIC
jgi:hypothetical protein